MIIRPILLIIASTEMPHNYQILVVLIAVSLLITSQKTHARTRADA